MKSKKIIQGAVIVVILMLVIAVYIIKNSGFSDMSGMQETIDGAAASLQSGRTPLEIENFTPDMLTESEKPMIIVMGEEWCQPCLRMLPDLTELQRTVDDIEIRYLDLEANQAAFDYFPIRVTPTIAVFEPAGEPFTPPEDSEIDYILYTYRDTGEHALTIHEGMLTREQLETMIEDLRK